MKELKLPVEIVEYNTDVSFNRTMKELKCTFGTFGTFGAFGAFLLIAP